MGSRHVARLSACFAALGAGCSMPWSAAVLCLPWLASAACSPPAASAWLRAGLPSALALLFSATNAVATLAVARLRLVERLPTSVLVGLPLAGCAALCAAASLAADADARGAPLSGAAVVHAALPAAVGFGVAAALSNCGTTALGASRTPRAWPWNVAAGNGGPFRAAL